MADTISPERRSQNMAAIKNKNTEPEVYLRKLLFKRGYRYRVSYPGIIGHPDIWLKKYNTAVFVHGCFWHRHVNCKFAYKPKSRIDFWESKFANNVARDKRVSDSLRQQGVKELVVWECTINGMRKDRKKEREVLSIIDMFLKTNDQFLEL